MESNLLTPVHLLYVPTLQCNLGCRYCYLGHETDTALTENRSPKEILSTLVYSVDRFRQHGYFPFNISLHGGEVTTLPAETLELLFEYITRYYTDNAAVLESFGIRKTVPHIKTNLLNFHSLVDLFEKYRVSISASVDLPLFLHEKYRTTKKGGSSLERILKNVRLLADYSYGKKISTTLFREHMDHKEQIAADIEKLHGEYGFDMNRFNIMFGFESAKNSSKFGNDESVDLQMVNDIGQVGLYEYLQQKFTGTELEKGLNGTWFEEFTPSYCTNCFNCGDKFFLLQADGSIYSCVRGQGTEEFYYGNIFDTEIPAIMQLAGKKISFVHKSFGFHEDCQHCDYLHLCQTGCPFVKQQTETGKSYTCKLQKRLYEDNPEQYSKVVSDEERNTIVLEYASDMHPNNLPEIQQKLKQGQSIVLPNDLYDAKNRLPAIIADDSILQELYSEDAFFIEIDGEITPLLSQILKLNRELFHLHSDQELVLHIRKSIFQANCQETIQNTLYIQMLRDTKVVYGDEKRTKQEHIFTHQMYYNTLTESSSLGEDYFSVTISGLLNCHKTLFLDGVLSNLFFTTGYLREYHYKKQKANGFYHIQALNLPFQNFEFFWD